MTAEVLASVQHQLAQKGNAAVAGTSVETPGFFERVFRAVENPFVQTPFSVIGGLVGIFWYGPLVMLCSISILAGLHRSRALEGLQRRDKIGAWALITVIALSSLYGLGRVLEKHRDHIPSAREIASQVWDGRWPLKSEAPAITYLSRSSSPQKKAKISFGFASVSGDVTTTLVTPEPPMILGPMRKMGPNVPPLPLPSRVVDLNLVGTVTSDVPAKNLVVFIKICADCDYFLVPEGFLSSTIWPNLKTDLSKSLGDMAAGPQFFVGHFQVAMPLHGNQADLHVAYTCDNCAPLKENITALAIKLTPNTVHPDGPEQSLLRPTNDAMPNRPPRP